MKNYYHKENGETSGGSSEPTKENTKESSKVAKKFQELERAFLAQTDTLNNAFDSIIGIDAERKITFFNKAAEEMFGYSKNEVVGEHAKIVIPQDLLSIENI